VSPSHLHSLFEGLAWIAALAVGLWIRRRFQSVVRLPLPGQRYPIFLLLVWSGAVAGAYCLGSLNPALAGIAGEGRSILGAILGGILVAESYKAACGIRVSTGAVFVLPLAIAIAIGRLG
jgi:phosphatidylglycerol---prolipoprotein diacylglyceryl transferase